MSQVLLYHVPPSFYSQIARIVLCELDVDFELKLAPPAPPTFDAYQPWYLKLNPMGTVPTMVHGETAVPDSDAIMRYAAEHLSSIDLVPQAPEGQEAMETWIAALRAISLRELSYGTEKTRKTGARINKLRLKVLTHRRNKYPDMADVYSAKIDDISGFAERAVDPEVAAANLAHVENKLDELNTLLSGQPWIAGSTYSFADAVWTVGVGRFIMLHLSPLENRAGLADWYARVKARPSFEQADVWEKFDVLSLLKAMSTRYRVPLACVGATIAALLWWCCGTCDTLPPV